MAREAFRSFVQATGSVPIETVGVRRSGRRPGERRLAFVRPAETEQSRTLLQEMQQYISLRQHLRELGHYQVMPLTIIGIEPANICLADATHNDLDAMVIGTNLPDNSKSIREKGNIIRVQHVFDAFAFSQFSEEKQHEIYRGWEGVKQFAERRGRKGMVFGLNEEEIVATSWLLEWIGVDSTPIKGNPDMFNYTDSALLWKMRTSTFIQS
jgi:hypothetical protein